MATNHNAPKEFQCHACGKAYSYKCKLTEHIKEKHEASPTDKRIFPYVCETCGKGVRSRADLEGHMAHKHNATKQHKCHICSEEFGYKHRLLNHMRVLHKVSVDDKKTNPFILLN